MAALTIELNDHIAIMADVEMKPFRNHWTGSILLDLTHLEIYSFESANKFAADGWSRRERLCDDNQEETVENWKSLEALVSDEYRDKIEEAWKA